MNQSYHASPASTKDISKKLRPLIFACDGGSTSPALRHDVNCLISRDGCGKDRGVGAKNCVCGVHKRIFIDVSDWVVFHNNLQIAVE